MALKSIEIESEFLLE